MVTGQRMKVVYGFENCNFLTQCGRKKKRKSGKLLNFIFFSGYTKSYYKMLLEKVGLIQFSFLSYFFCSFSGGKKNFLATMAFIQLQIYILNGLALRGVLGFIRIDCNRETGQEQQIYFLIELYILFIMNWFKPNFRLSNGLAKKFIGRIVMF